ncbi:glycosyltransferase 87 family protein [Cellulomonas aerilata]|uniref:DUF2029 domain-containing protein n=1 Tax=Cellulomonas aerilata TaxID=515326 RepID=A0A512D826_9CELL|nr:glycosyltransferase 87 family protein [Cellulomonas aerilata]GEO32652.1 hypothetical protein CAE01nite_03770 [Cellulomonas aerilata]
MTPAVEPSPVRAGGRERRTSTPPGAVHRLGRSRIALWAAFAVVHGWLALLGVVLIPARGFWDVDLYRWWATLALDGGRWPVLDDPWVYPAGALGPVLAPALTGVRSTSGYATGWCVMVTVLDAVAVAVLLRASAARAGARPQPTATGTGGPDPRGVPVGAWWWLAFLPLLGPVAMGRLDAVVAPVTVVALAVAVRRPRVAAALLTVGAWIKVAPGALVVPLAAAARRPVRDVVVPAAVVCAAVVGLVAAGGGLARVTGFLTEQSERGLQLESVAATPWVVAGLVDDRVRIEFDTEIVTWEVAGPGTGVALAVLDVALPLALGALGALLVVARRRPQTDPVAMLLWGSLAASVLLIAANKVGSPQFVGWLAAPVAVALTVAPSRAWSRVGAAVLGTAALTQLVFPLGADGLPTGDPAVTAVLVVRNAALVALAVVAVRGVMRSVVRDVVPGAAAGTVGRGS